MYHQGYRRYVAIILVKLQNQVRLIFSMQLMEKCGNYPVIQVSSSFPVVIAVEIPSRPVRSSLDSPSDVFSPSLLSPAQDANFLRVFVPRPSRFSHAMSTTEIGRSRTENRTEREHIGAHSIPSRASHPATKRVQTGSLPPRSARADPP